MACYFQRLFTLHFYAIQIKKALTLQIELKLQIFYYRTIKEIQNKNLKK